VEAGAKIEDLDSTVVLSETSETTHNEKWLNPADSGDDSDVDFTANADWDPVTNSAVSNYMATLAPGATGSDRVLYAAKHAGYGPGDDMANPTKVIYTFDLYGLYDVARGGQFSGKHLISMGYKRDVYLY